ncbi:MAG TPA: amicyanin [Methyloceanibacter sp.]|nr:amicyanin [Methyloceanibacter sp.]
MTRSRLSRAAALLAGLAVLLSNAEAFAAETQVKIANFTFDPVTFTVPVGTTVTWINDDDIAHVIKEIDNRFHSGALDTGDTFSAPSTRACGKNRRHAVNAARLGGDKLRMA